MNYIIRIIVLCLSVSASISLNCESTVEKSNISVSCSKQLEILCTHRHILFKLWDSSSRVIHSGLLETNNIDLGNFDLCMTIDNSYKDVNILGKYCPLSWLMVIPPGILEELVYKYELQEISDKKEVALGENSDDIKVLGSLCIPDGCTIAEFTQIFHPYIYVNYLDEMDSSCFTKYTKYKLSTSEVVISICFGIFALLLVGCTIWDLLCKYSELGEPHNLIKAFSCYYNGKKLVTINKNNAEQFQCIHGIRTLSIMWIIAGHSFSMSASLPVINFPEDIEWIGQLYSQYIQAAHFAVDTFFFLSGFFLAFGYLKVAKNRSIGTQVKGIPLMYLQRYLRLTPAIAALFLVTISFMNLLGDGPLWLSAVNKIGEPCRQYWWRYFLYIQNYFPTKEMCYLPTWYLSADMQMFLLAPIAVIPSTFFFQKNLRGVFYGLSILTAVCVGISILIPFIFDDYTNAYDTHSRLGNYLVGMIGGILMYRNKGKHVKIYRVLNIFLWVMAISVMIFLSLYLHDVSQNPTKVKTSLFYPLCRPLWSLCILWIIFSCYFGYGGIVNEFLSLPVFQIGGKLSYCMYVVHSLVLLISITNVRTYGFVSDYSLLNNVCNNVILTIIVSVFWTLAFESPMILLTRMLVNWIGSFTAAEKPKVLNT